MKAEVRVPSRVTMARSGPPVAVSLTQAETEKLAAVSTTGLNAGSVTAADETPLNAAAVEPSTFRPGTPNVTLLAAASLPLPDTSVNTPDPARSAPSH